MLEAPSIVAGFNHTVKHGGRSFHVQTEDSGVGSPRIVTHLFLGGNVLASKRTDYGELLLAEALPALVKELMEEQHKEVLRNLVAGVYDAPGAEAAPAYQPGQLDLGGAPRGGDPPIVVRPEEAPERARAAGAGEERSPAALGEGSSTSPEGVQPAGAAGTEGATAATPAAVAPSAERPLDEIILSYLGEEGGRG